MTSTLSVPNMSSELFLPSFIPASKSSAHTNLESLSNDDTLDFDLLAEYLLDEGNSDNLIFDFGSESASSNEQLQTTAVSPDLSSPSVADLAPDNNVSNIAKGQIINPSPGFPSNTSIQKISIASNPGATSAMAAPPILHTVIAPKSNGAPKQMIVHQHKRQRIESSYNQPVQIAQAHSPRPAHLAVAPITTGSKHGRQKSQAQIDRRRERNRILARRTRLRKKFFFESLQKEVMELQKENSALKDIVQSRIDSSISQSILASCKANEELPDVVIELCGGTTLGGKDFNLINSVKSSQQNFVITDPSLPDNPIVYASDGFLSLTEYTRDQILGRNCRFLQGEDTHHVKVDQIRKAVSSGDDVSVTFVNYTANGDAFWNKLFIAALRDANNNIVNYIGVSVKVAGPDHGDIEEGKLLPGQDTSDETQPEYGNDSATSNIASDSSYADAAVMAIEGVVTKAVAAASTVVKISPAPLT